MPREQDFLQERNREIGAALEEARLLQRKTVTECAALLKTSRRRYNAMERGEIAISIAEMELLLQYLKISGTYVSPQVFTFATRSVVVQELPEEIIVRVPKQSEIVNSPLPTNSCF